MCTAWIDGRFFRAHLLQIVVCYLNISKKKYI